MLYVPDMTKRECDMRPCGASWWGCCVAAGGVRGVSNVVDSGANAGSVAVSAVAQLEGAPSGEPVGKRSAAVGLGKTLEQSVGGVPQFAAAAVRGRGLSAAVVAAATRP